MVGRRLGRTSVTEANESNCKSSIRTPGFRSISPPARRGSACGDHVLLGAASRARRHEAGVAVTVRRARGESEVPSAAGAETRFHTSITSVVPWLVVSDCGRGERRPQDPRRDSFGHRTAAGWRPVIDTRSTCRARGCGPAPPGRTGSGRRVQRPVRRSPWSSVGEAPSTAFRWPVGSHRLCEAHNPMIAGGSGPPSRRGYHTE